MSRADLAFTLSALIEAHGSTAVLATLSGACHVAAEHEAGKASAEYWTQARVLLARIVHDVQEAEALGVESNGVTLDMALTVLADAVGA
jgi:hypothetical protein